MTDPLHTFFFPEKIWNSGILKSEFFSGIFVFFRETFGKKTKFRKKTKIPEKMRGTARRPEGATRTRGEGAWVRRRRSRIATDLFGAKKRRQTTHESFIASQTHSTHLKTGNFSNRFSILVVALLHPRFQPNSAETRIQSLVRVQIPARMAFHALMTA